ncbi:MAG: carboxypeptidase-like regulatory domain-containing protein [Candidatus Gastranaerophilales bacterium]|nr:carboxypeptidase-like regulatory domain-containing protein [Candidatus Gastranaerophilales bacterium]
MPVFAACANPENTISYIVINDQDTFDVEILYLPNSQIYLPFKQMAVLFDIPFKVNHGANEICFETPDHQKGVVSLSNIKLDNKVISTAKNYYLKSGIMADIKDEIFVPPQVLGDLFGVAFNPKSDDLSVEATTERNLSALKKEELIDSSGNSKQIKGYTQIVLPDEKRKISLDRVSFNNNTTSDSYAQMLYNQMNSNFMFNNNTQIAMNGQAYGGKYTIDYNTFNYTDKLFSFGGLGLRYENEYKNNYYQVGKVSGIGAENSIGENTFGINIKNYNENEKKIEDKNGYVSAGSIVNVYVNGDFLESLNTYNGYYSLKEAHLPKNLLSIKLEEEKETGEKNTFFDEKYDTSDYRFKKRKPKNVFLIGANGFNNRLWAENGALYAANAKKLVIGLSDTRVITDKLQIENKITADKIVKAPDYNIWGMSYSKAPSLYSGTYINSNNLEGVTCSTDAEYRFNKNLSLFSTLALSASNDKSISQLGAGYKAEISPRFKTEKYEINARAYNYSPSFYLAATEFGTVTDRLGVGINASGDTKVGNIGFSLNHYYSNLNHKFENGIMKFNELNFRYSLSLSKYGNVNINTNIRQGENDTTMVNNTYYNVEYNKNIGRNLYLTIGQNVSNLKTESFIPQSSYSDTSSEYKMQYTKLNWQIPSGKGGLQIANEGVKIGGNNFINDYQIARIEYTFPMLKRINLSIGTGYRYTGDIPGFEYLVKLGYSTKSGRTYFLNYQYSKLNGYMVDNMFIPGSNRHSINLSVNDNFAVLNGLRSVGITDRNKGFVNVVAYLDKNENGKFDKSDVKVKGVPIKCSWKNEIIYTNSKGTIPVQAINQGVYQISVDTESLPTILSLSKECKESNIVKIDAEKNTNIEIPIESSVGNITGKLVIKDDFDRDLPIKDFIIVVDDNDGNEIAYTTVNNDGSYYFSGIKPGKYTVKLDNSFIEDYSLETIEGMSEKHFEIPYVYKKFVEINDLNLEYKSL